MCLSVNKKEYSEPEFKICRFTVKQDLLTGSEDHENAYVDIGDIDDFFGEFDFDIDFG